MQLVSRTSLSLIWSLLLFFVHSNVISSIEEVALKEIAEATAEKVLSHDEPIWVDNLVKSTSSFLEQHHHTGPAPVPMEIDPKKPRILSHRIAELDVDPGLEINRRKRPRPMVVPSSVQEVPESSIKRPITNDGTTQGRTSSCHIFATATLVQDATGKLISTARLFLDHLIEAGKYMNSETAHDVVIEKNQQFIQTEKMRVSTAGERCNGNFFSWEAGNFRKDLDVLKRVGGVIVPHNGDFKQVEQIVNRLRDERLFQILDAPAITEAESKKRLSNSGVREIVEKAHSPVDLTTMRNIEWDRELIKKELKDFQTEWIPFDRDEKVTPQSIQRRITTLVNTLESNAIWLGVQTKSYWPVLKGNHIPITPLTKFEESGNHAVAIVGYHLEDDSFFIKDSNHESVLIVKATDIILSMASAFILKK